jgi:hypothetical protein
MCHSEGAGVGVALGAATKLGTLLRVPTPSVGYVMTSVRGALEQAQTSTVSARTTASMATLDMRGTEGLEADA